MSDIYKIAVNLAMTSNAPSFLASLVNQLHIAHVHVKELEGGLNNLSRVKLAVGGGLAIAGGAAMLGMLKNLTDAAKDLNHQLAGVATMSANPIQSVQLQAQALAVARATAAKVNGTDLAENAKLYGETYSMFGADNAAKINAPLAKFGQVLGSITGSFEQANEQLYALIRAGDLSGKLVDEKTHLVDTDKLMHFLDLSAKVAAATHGKVGPQQIFQLAQQGAPALKGMDDDGILTMAMAAQGMGGFRSGTAAMSMFSQFAGGKMTKQVAEELKKFGLVGDFDVIRGGGVQFKAGALETDFIKALRKDPAAGAVKLQEALHKAGLNDEQVGTEIFKILGRQTTQRLMSDLLSNLPQMLAERGRIKGAQGMEDQYSTREDKDYERNLHDAQTAWHNFMTELGLPLTTQAIGVLKYATETLKGWTAVVQKMDPNTIANIGKGVGILGASLVGAGSIALLAALGPAGWIAGGIIGLAAAVAMLNKDDWKSLGGKVDGFFASYFKNIKDGVGSDLKSVDDFFGTYFKNIREGVSKDFAAMLAEVQSWPGRLVGAIKEFGQSLVSAIGDELKGLFSHLNPFSKTAYEGSGLGGGLINAAYVTGGGANDNMPGIVNQSGGVINIVYGGGADGTAAGGLIRASYGGGGGGYNDTSGGSGDRYGGFRGTGGGRGSGNFSAAEMSRGMHAMGLLQKIGWTPEAAASLISQGMEESNLTPNGPAGDHGTAHGMFQWRFERFAALKKFAAALGQPWTNFDTQVLFAAHEAETRGLGNWAHVHSLYEGGRYGKSFEGYGTNTFGNRLANSETLLRNYREHGVAAVPPPPKKPHETVIHNHMHVDGKVMARSVTRHQEYAGMFPTAVGGIDAHGSFASPGTPLLDVA